MATVHTFLPVSGDPDALAEAFAGDPGRWLPDVRHAAPDAWRVRVRAGAFSREVAVRVGDPWGGAATRWRSLTWEPVPETGTPGLIDRLLPSLEAELGLHRHGASSVTLMLDGRYQPPGGVVGDAVDAVAMGRVADATVARFVADVAARLTAAALLLSARPQRAPSTQRDVPAQDRPGPLRG